MTTFAANAIGIGTLVGVLEQTSGRVVICNPFEQTLVQAALNAHHLDHVDVVTSVLCPLGELICALFVTVDTIQDFIPPKPKADYEQ